MKDSQQGPIVAAVFTLVVPEVKERERALAQTASIAFMVAELAGAFEYAAGPIYVDKRRMWPEPGTLRIELSFGVSNVTREHLREFLAEFRTMLPGVPVRLAVQHEDGTSTEVE